VLGFNEHCNELPDSINAKNFLINRMSDILSGIILFPRVNYMHKMYST